MSVDTTRSDSGGRGGRLPRHVRRAQLLDAAQDIFVSSGYHAAAMDAIADRAGVSKPVLYQHFPSKRDLYMALLDEHCRAVVELIRTSLRSTTDNKARVEAAVMAYFEFFERDGSPFRLVFESDLTGDEEVRARLDTMTAKVTAAMAEVIGEDAALPAEHAHLLATAVAGAATGAAREWITGGAAVPREDAARLVMMLAWRGLSGFPKVG